MVGNLALGKLLLLSLSFLPRTGARISDLPPSGVKMGATEMGICSYLAVTTHSTSVGHERHRQVACSQGPTLSCPTSIQHLEQEGTLY